METVAKLAEIYRDAVIKKIAILEAREEEETKKRSAKNIRKIALLWIQCLGHKTLKRIGDIAECYKTQFIDYLAQRLGIHEEGWIRQEEITSMEAVTERCIAVLQRKYLEEERARATQ